MDGKGVALVVVPRRCVAGGRRPGRYCGSALKQQRDGPLEVRVLHRLRVRRS